MSKVHVPRGMHIAGHIQRML